MSSNWPTFPLEECLDALIDYRGKTPTKTTSGVPLVTAKVIKAGRIETPTEFIAHEDFESWMRRGMPQPGDVVMTTEAPLGEVAQLGREKVALAQRVITLRGKKDFLDNDYLLYLLLSEEMQDQLKARATGTTVLGIKQSELRKISVTVPPFSIQQDAASVLKAIDSRIAILRETNATLEAIAQALFKSWFVDFDPVHANAGTQAPSLPPEIQALFPATFTDSPQGPIPDGWNIGIVGDFAQQKKGSVNPLLQPETLFEHFSLPAFDNDQAPVLELGEEIKSNKTPLPKEAVLLSKLNPHIPRLWLPIEYGDTAVCSTEFLAYSPKGASSKEFIYCAFSSEKFTTHLCQLVTGTSNSHQRVKPDQVLLIETVLPSDEIFKQFELITNPIFAQVHKNRVQSQTLAALRDTLLPRLISGQLRLPEAKQAIAAITD